MANSQKQKKLGLSLRGGGARCAVYLGVIKALEENNITIDYIIGASGGVLVGGAYAAGKTIEEITHHFMNSTIRKYIGIDSIRDLSLASDDKALKYAKALIGDMSIEDTKIPFYVQVTSVKTRECVILDKGSLAEAAIASSAIPGVLKPVTFMGEQYYDGDLSSGYGSKFLREKGADVVIGLTNALWENGNEESPLAQRTLAIWRILNHNLLKFDQELNPVDLLIKINMDHIGLFDFNKAEDLVKEGYKITKKLLPKIKKLIT